MQQNKLIDELAKEAFCKILGAVHWPYDHAPSYYYNLWESGREPWLEMSYPEHRQGERFVCKWIHDIYCRVAGIITFEI